MSLVRKSARIIRKNVAVKFPKRTWYMKPDGKMVSRPIVNDDIQRRKRVRKQLRGTIDEIRAMAVRDLIYERRCKTGKKSSDKPPVKNTSV